MKKLLFLILVLFTVNITFSQINTNVSLKCQIYASSGTAPTFNVQSLVSDELSKYDGSSVAAGDKLFIIDGSECYELHISSVSSGIGSTLNIVVYDSTGTLATVPNGQAAVIRKYSTQQVPFIPSGLRNDLASCILQKLASVIDNIGSDGNGIYSGSDTLSVGDTTVVTTLAGSALKVGNTIQSPSSITTINDVNHWGTYDGWDRATYSYGGHSGYYFIRGNGTAASKTALSVNDVMHEWSFIGQKSPTEDNYALIMKPTVDEVTSGTLWGRLDLQGADFGTWLSFRRTGIRAGTASNYTTFPALRPVTNNQFWQYNTDGTGQYLTPGQMAIINPIGGSNTLQAAIDSIAIAGGADGNGIYSGSGSLSNNTTVSGGSFGLTVSTTEASTPGLTTSSPYTGLQASSTNGSTALYGITGNSSTTTVLNSLSLLRNTTGTAGNGIGQSIALAHETSNGVPYTGNEIKSLWSNATTASRTSRFIISGVNSGTLADKFTIEGNGQVKFNAYTTNTQIGTGWGRFVAQADGTVAVDTTSTDDGNGIYGGSGSVPNGTTAATLGTFTLGNSLGNHLFIENGNEAALYSDLSRVSVKDSVIISSAGSDGALGQVLVATAGDGSYWGNAASLPVVNPLGGANTIQAALDSLNTNSGDGNGIFDVSNNNDTVRVATTNLKSVWNINNNTSGYIRIQRPSAAFVQGLNITSPGGITGSQVHSAFVSDRISIQDRLDNVNITSSYDMILGGRIASGDFAQMSLKTGVAEFTSSNGGRLKLLDAGLTTSITIQPPVVPVAYTITLPTTDGNSGEFLQTNGSGVTTWAAPAAPTNVGGISAMHTGASYSYSATTLGSAVNALTLSGTVAFKSGMTKITSDSGHGIQVTFGGAATCQITGFVTLTGDEGGDGPYYLQIYVNGSPLYSSVYASTLPAPAYTNAATATISHLADLNNNDIVTIRVHSAVGDVANILSAGLTVVKTQ